MAREEELQLQSQQPVFVNVQEDELVQNQQPLHEINGNETQENLLQLEENLQEDGIQIENLQGEEEQAENLLEDDILIGNLFDEEETPLTHVLDNLQQDYEHEEILDQEQQKTMETWAKNADAAIQATADMEQYREMLDNLYEEGRLTAEQICSRIDAILRVHEELDGDSQYLIGNVKASWDAYEAAREEMLALKDEIGENWQLNSMREHLTELKRAE